MDVTELHDEENLLVQMQDRWERSALPLRYAKNLLLRQTLGMGCKQRSVKSLALTDGNNSESRSEEARHDRRETTASRRFHRALEIPEPIK